MSLLFKDEVKISDFLTVRIPTLGEIFENEDAYYSVVSLLTSMPIDMMVQLDDMGIDFSEVDDYFLFVYLFPVLKKLDTHLIFGELDLSKFEVAVNENGKDFALVDAENGWVINRPIQNEIATALRDMHNLEKNTKKPANEDAKKYMLERERKRMRRKKKPRVSQIESLVISLVNTPEFKYNYQSVFDMTIYQFNVSAKQIIKRIDYGNKMVGIYTGNIDIKNINKDELTWLYK